MKKQARSWFRVAVSMTLTLFMAVVFPLASLLVPSVASASISSWQKSISIYPNYSTDFGSSDFNNVVTHMKSLGFNYVTLIVPYTQTNDFTTDIRAAGNTPTDASLISAIQFVHSQGMAVNVDIHIDPADNSWRALINPSDRTTWFANYKNLVTKYATLSQQNGVEEFCVGTELISMSSQTVNSGNTAQWLNIIAAVRGVFKGKVFYDANWGGGDFENEPPQIGFWSALDYIGISGYYDLSGDGSVSSLESNWDGWNNSTIRPLSQQYGKPILFSEIGYRSSTNAHLEPWNPFIGTDYNPQEQINDYTALFEYWNNYSYFAGVGIWYAMTSPSAGGSGNTDYFIAGKPVEQTFTQWFTSPPAGGGGGNSGTPSFTVTASASPSAGSTGQSETLNISVADQGGSVSSSNVDIEVIDAGGHQVFQKIFVSQTFGSGQTQQYSVNWTPSSTGTYKVSVGVFNQSWSTLYTWADGAASVQVGSSGGGGGGGGTQTTDVWWPGNGVTVSGVQPFKAIVENLSLPQYTMYWQVGSGQLNQMFDSQTDYPHKESMVDLSGWNWNGTGPYVLTFVSKNSSGTIISQKSVSITISH